MIGNEIEINGTTTSSNSPLIYKKMANVMRKVGAVAKTSKNTAQGYSYRSVDDVFNELHNIFAEEGIFITYTTLNKEVNHLESEVNGKTSLVHEVVGDIEYSFCAEDGSSISTVVSGYALDRGDKAMGKLYSYSIKYALMHMFLIPTSDSLDPDKDVAPTVTKKQAPKKTQQFSNEDIDTIAKKITDELALVTNLTQLKSLYEKYTPHSSKLSDLFTKAKNRLMGEEKNNEEKNNL
jgi:hypothetical protein